MTHPHPFGSTHRDAKARAPQIAQAAGAESQLGARRNTRVFGQKLGRAMEKRLSFQADTNSRQITNPAAKATRQQPAERQRPVCGRFTGREAMQLSAQNRRVSGGLQGVSTATKGRVFEHEIRDLFRTAGFSVMRGAGSKGEFLEEKTDLICTRLTRETRYRVLLTIVGVQCKARRRRDAF